MNLFAPLRGLYRDGEGADHASMHANLFPLVFGFVPAENRDHIAQWLGERGMACSVYAAQYLLEGSFENDQRRRKNSDAAGSGSGSLGKRRCFQTFARPATRHDRANSASGR